MCVRSLSPPGGVTSGHNNNQRILIIYNTFIYIISLIPSITQNFARNPMVSLKIGVAGSKFRDIWCYHPWCHSSHSERGRGAKSPEMKDHIYFSQRFGINPDLNSGVGGMMSYPPFKIARLETHFLESCGFLQLYTLFQPDPVYMPADSLSLLAASPYM